MGRISETFAKLNNQKRRAFIAYAMVGYPSLDVSQQLAQGLLDRGADLLEIGVPFSDPLADGVVIQKAADAALAQGAGLAQGLELAGRLRMRNAAPLLIMSYYNPVLQFGLEKFVDQALAKGVDGAIIPDLPPEEGGAFAALCKKRGFDLIFLASPTSTPARLKKIAALASGFIYFVSVAGVTGAHSTFDSLLKPTVAALKKLAPRIPLAIGFGVADRAKAREAAGLAEGVVVASAVIRGFQDSSTVAEGLAKALASAGELIDEVHATRT